MEEISAKKFEVIFCFLGSFGFKTIGVARSHTTNVPIYAWQKLSLHSLITIVYSFCRA